MSYEESYAFEDAYTKLTDTKTMKKISKQGCLRTLGGLAGAILLLIALKIIITPLPGSVITPSGAVRNQSLYVPMRDGVQLAVDLFLPADLAEGEAIPALMRTTRYGRLYEAPFLTKMLVRLGTLPEQEMLDEEAMTFNEAGYAVIFVDARGSGASFGTRSAEWSADEIADWGDLADWVVAQPWSNGKIGTWGISYEGNTAELSTIPNHPAIQAAAPQYSDFDPLFYLARPGGVFNRGFIDLWHAGNAAMDDNDICRLANLEGYNGPCFLVKWLFTPGIKPVDEDRNGRLLAAALAERDNINVLQAVETTPFRDNNFGQSGITAAAFSPYGLRSQIEASSVPLFVWVSWLDAGTVDGALSRYLTFSNPQKLIIGPWSHGGSHHTDPFLPANAPTDPSPQEQQQMLIDFFDAYLKNKLSAEPAFEITYYTMGEGVWKTTTVWPPAGVREQAYYFADDGVLTAVMPDAENGADEYIVDFSATTGTKTRWHTQLDGGDVVYEDRAQEDEKLLTYTSRSLTTDIEITGSPTVTFYVSSTNSDGAFHVYLEDVAPDGRVTYITEGILRAVHHSVSENEPPYIQLGPYLSFNEADAAPLVPGEITEIQITLYATSVYIREGHRLRIAIAGHDAAMFDRYPAEGTPTWQVQRNALYPSRVTLPIIEP